MSAPRPANEGARLQALRRYDVLDTAPEPAFDRITSQAAEIFGVPICLVSLVDENRNWFKSRHGLEIQEIQREQSFCAYAILSDDVMVVPDARADPRFADTTLVTGAPGIRFYGGAPLRTRDGFNLGTLCICNTVAQGALTADREAILKGLAALVVDELEVHLLVRKARAAERIRCDMQRLLARAFGSAPFGIAITDEQGQFVKVNEAYCQLVGCTEEELIGQPFVETLSSESRDVVEQTSRVAIEAGCKDPTGWRIQRRGGDLIDVRAACAPLVREDGTTCKVLMFSDITAAKQLEEYLRWSEKMEAISRLAGKVAHDFNNLLTIITGFGQLVKNSVEPHDPLCGFANEILKASDRASVLTGKFLMLSGRRVGKPQLLDLNSLITNLGGSLRQVIGQEVELVAVLEPDLRKVNADPSHVGQLILNLTVNAREAMPAGGRITIETSNIELGEDYARERPNVKPGLYVLLTVRDTGEGMDAETRKRLFEPLFTTKEPGRGTGLATVYGIVKQCGGLISVWSTRGKGTTVDVFLPAARETAEPPEPEAPDKTATIKTVLPVDDGAAARNSVRNMAGEEGHKSLEPKSAEVVDSVRRLLRLSVTKTSVLLVLTLAALTGILGTVLKPWSATETLGGAKAGAASGSALGLTAHVEGGQLLLSWNWEAEPIKTADQAILSITDGGQKEDIELDPVVLRTKRLVYSPVTNDVSFRLQVANFQHNSTASECVRVLTPRPNGLAVSAQEHPQSPAPAVLP